MPALHAITDVKFVVDLMPQCLNWMLPMCAASTTHLRRRLLPLQKNLNMIQLNQLQPERQCRRWKRGTFSGTNSLKSKLNYKTTKRFSKHTDHCIAYNE
jgi:hypothetical protein